MSHQDQAVCVGGPLLSSPSSLGIVPRSGRRRTRRLSETDHLPRDFCDDMRIVNGRKKFQREEKFRARFMEVPQEEALINYYSCAFNKDYYLQHGALYVTSNYICFRSNIFGHERKLVIPTAEVRHVDKVNTFRLIPSGIAIITADEKFHFESFLNRQSAFETLKNATSKHFASSASTSNIPGVDQPGRTPAASRAQRLQPLESSSSSSTRRFIKSQSSCSLERKDVDEDQHDDVFLRPLSAAAVTPDYVARRPSRPVALAVAIPPSDRLLHGTAPVLAHHHHSLPHSTFSAPSLKIMRDSVDGDCTETTAAGESGREQPPVVSASPTNSLLPQLLKSHVNFQWDDATPDCDPVITIRISVRCLVKLGYVLCFLLTLSACIFLSDVFTSSRPSATVPRSETISPMPPWLQSADASPLNDTLHLLHSVCDVTQKLLRQTQQRHLQKGS